MTEHPSELEGSWCDSGNKPDHCPGTTKQGGCGEATPGGGSLTHKAELCSQNSGVSEAWGQPQGHCRRWFLASEPRGAALGQEWGGSDLHTTHIPDGFRKMGREMDPWHQVLPWPENLSSNCKCHQAPSEILPISPETMSGNWDVPGSRAWVATCSPSLGEREWLWATKTMLATTQPVHSWFQGDWAPCPWSQLVHKKDPSHSLSKVLGCPLTCSSAQTDTTFHLRAS